MIKHFSGADVLERIAKLLKPVTTSPSSPITGVQPAAASFERRDVLL